LPDGLARAEVWDVGLDVEDGRAVDRIELAHEDVEPVNALDLAGRDANAIRAVFRALGENAYEGPVGTIARVTRTGEDFVGRDAIEKEDDIDVRKFVEAARAVGSELICVELDFGNDLGPAVVGGRFDFGMDETYGPHCEFGGEHGAPFGQALSDAIVGCPQLDSANATIWSKAAQGRRNPYYFCEL
jgi:hypothetical protein